MMLTIHGIPKKVKMFELKALIMQMCNIKDYILDNFNVDDDALHKKVRIGVANDAEGAVVMRCLDNCELHGSQLRVRPVGSDSVPKQTSYPYDNNPPYQQPYNNGDFLQNTINRPYVASVPNPERVQDALGRKAPKPSHQPMTRNLTPVTIYKDHFQGPSNEFRRLEASKLPPQPLQPAYQPPVQPWSQPPVLPHKPPETYLNPNAVPYGARHGQVNQPSGPLKMPGDFDIPTRNVLLHSQCPTEHYSPHTANRPQVMGRPQSPDRQQYPGRRPSPTRQRPTGRYQSDGEQIPIENHPPIRQEFPGKHQPQQFPGRPTPSGQQYPGRRPSPSRQQQFPGRGPSPSRRPSPSRQQFPGRGQSPSRRPSPSRQQFPGRGPSPDRRQSPSRHQFPGRGQSPNRRPSPSRQQQFSGRGPSPDRQQFPGRGQSPSRRRSPSRQQQFPGRGPSPDRRQSPSRQQFPGRGKSPSRQQQFPGRGPSPDRRQSPSRQQFPGRGQSPSRQQFPGRGQSPSRQQFPGRHQSPNAHRETRPPLKTRSGYSPSSGHGNQPPRDRRSEHSSGKSQTYAKPAYDELASVPNKYQAPRHRPDDRNNPSRTRSGNKEDFASERYHIDSQQRIKEDSSSSRQTKSPRSHKRGRGSVSSQSPPRSWNREKRRECSPCPPPPPAWPVDKREHEGPVWEISQESMQWRDQLHDLPSREDVIRRSEDLQYLEDRDPKKWNGRGRAVDELVARILEKNKDKMRGERHGPIIMELNKIVSSMVDGLLGERDVPTKDIIFKYQCTYSEQEENEVFNNVMFSFSEGKRRATEDSLDHERANKKSKNSELMNTFDMEPRKSEQQLAVRSTRWDSMMQVGVDPNSSKSMTPNQPSMCYQIDPNHILPVSHSLEAYGQPVQGPPDQDSYFPDRHLYLCNAEFSPISESDAVQLKSFLVGEIFAASLQSQDGWAPTITLKGLQSSCRFEVVAEDEPSKVWVHNLDFSSFQAFPVLVYNKEELWYERAVIWLPAHSRYRNIKPITKLYLQNRHLEGVDVGKWKLVKTIVTEDSTRLYVDIPPQSARALEKYNMLLSFELVKVNVYLKAAAFDKVAFDVAFRESSLTDPADITKAEQNTPMISFKYNWNVVRFCLKGNKLLSFPQATKVKDKLVYMIYRHQQEREGIRTDFTKFGFCMPGYFGVIPENIETERWLSTLDMGNLKRHPVVMVGDSGSSSRYLEMEAILPVIWDMVEPKVVLQTLMKHNANVEGLHVNRWKTGETVTARHNSSTSALKVFVDLESAVAIRRKGYRLQFSRYHVEFRHRYKDIGAIMNSYKVRMKDNYVVADMEMSSGDEEGT